MPYFGKVASHELESSVGIIKPNNSADGVLFLEGDIAKKPTIVGSLVGKEVSFDLVQTDRGPMAVNIVLLRSKLLRPGNAMGAILSLPLASGIGYFFWEYLRWTPLVSYLAAVNLVAFMLIVCQGNQPYSQRLRPAEIAVAAFAVAGGALAAFFATLLVPSRWYGDAGRFGLLALIVAHGFALHAIAPELFTRDAKRYLHRDDDGGLDWPEGLTPYNRR